MNTDQPDSGGAPIPPNPLSPVAVRLRQLSARCQCGEPLVSYTNTANPELDSVACSDQHCDRSTSVYRHWRMDLMGIIGIDGYEGMARDCWEDGFAIERAAEWIGADRNQGGGE